MNFGKTLVNFNKNLNQINDKNTKTIEFLLRKTGNI